MTLRTCMAAALLLAAPIGAQAGTGTAEFTAIVSASGSIQGGSGVQSVTKTENGVYQIVFPRGVAACAVVASTNDKPGSVTSKTLGASPTTLVAKTFNAKGVAASLDFTVLIKCQD